MTIVFASNNKDKLREIRQILEPRGFTVISQSEAGADLDVPETGTTFEENAFLKASAVFERTKLPVIADDSGIEVDYLNGAPGVYSARYAPDGGCCEKLLKALSGVPDGQRGARFVCAVCHIDENGSAFTVRGVVNGAIGKEPRGDGGFGSDPVFLYPAGAADARAFAQMSAEEKNAVSHRAAALRRLCERLSETKS
jgi:XTP/dITP diphosphohydrolase